MDTMTHTPQRLACAAFCLLLLLAATSSAFACSEDDDKIDNLINARKYDEIVTKDGEVYKGRIVEQDNDSIVQIRDVSNIVRSVPKANIREIRRAAKPEEELERLAKEAAGNPAKMFCLAREATTKYNLQARVIPILERFPNPDEPLQRLLGSLYLNSSQADKALKIAEKLIGGPKPKAKSLTLYAQALAALDRTEEAEKAIQKARADSPSDLKIALTYADLLSRLGRIDDARKSFDDVLAPNPRNVEAITGKGNVQLRAGDFTAAMQTFQEALAISKDFKMAHIGLAACEIMNKQYDDAFSEAVLALNVDNLCSEAFAIQAYARIFKGDPASLDSVDTKGFIRDALEHKPNQPRLLLAEYVKLDRQAKYEELKSEKEKNAGLIAQKRAAAIAKLNEVLASDTADGYIQFFIAEHRFREAEDAKRRNDTGAYDTALAKAEEAYRRCTKLSPNFAPVYSSLGATLLRLKKFDDARTVFAKAAELDKSAESADAVAGQGLALLSNAQKLDEAKPFFAKALALDPNNVPALCGRGYIANWERDKDGAKKHFESALAVDGDCAYAANALQLIYKQDDREMDYVRFPGPEWPQGWKTFSPGTVKWTMSNGQAVLSGTQGNAAGTKIELSHPFPNASKFERIEADLSINPACAASFGLRVSTGNTGNAAFEFEFGKDETGPQLKIRYRDSNNVTPMWVPIPNQEEWPKSGRVRLGIETDGIKMGETKFRVSVNGRRYEIPLHFQQAPKALTLGIFAQVQPKETISASVNNVAVVKNGISQVEKENTAVEIKPLNDPKPDEKKPDEKKPDEKGK